MDSFQLAVETGLSVLLLVTIFYSLYLGRALTVLRRDRAELDALLGTLQASTTQAQSGIDHLRHVAERVVRSLEKNIENGKLLKGELGELCHRAERMTEKFEPMSFNRPIADLVEPTGSYRERNIPMSTVSQRTSSAARGSNNSVGKSAAERELLQALRLKQG